MSQLKGLDGFDSAHIQELLSNKEYQLAEALIRSHLSTQPNDPDAHYLLGVLFYFQGQIPKTIESIKKALKLNPQHTDAAISLSVLLNYV
jgi:tetratricopeptide (TPR) repeat protein